MRKRPEWASDRFPKPVINVAYLPRAPTRVTGETPCVCLFLDYSKNNAIKEAKKKAPEVKEPGPKREEEKITQKGAEILP